MIYRSVKFLVILLLYPEACLPKVGKKAKFTSKLAYRMSDAVQVLLNERVANRRYDAHNALETVLYRRGNDLIEQPLLVLRGYRSLVRNIGYPVRCIVRG